MNCPTGKLQYATPHMARKAAAALRRRDKKRKAHIYHCRDCRAYHLSSMSQQQHDGQARRRLERF